MTLAFSSQNISQQMFWCQCFSHEISQRVEFSWCLLTAMSFEFPERTSILGTRNLEKVELQNYFCIWFQNFLVKFSCWNSKEANKKEINAEEWLIYSAPLSLLDFLFKFNIQSVLISVCPQHPSFSPGSLNPHAKGDLKILSFPRSCWCATGLLKMRWT